MEKVRIGVIGVGGMGSNHLESIKKTERADLAAVCDIRKDVADEKALKYGVKAYYRGEDMMKSGDVDAVIIATPHYDHTPLTIAGFEHGLHVLTEKPIAVHKQDAEKMVEAHSMHKSLVFAAMFQMRTDGMYKKVKQLISSGELGRLMRVSWVITNWFRSQAYYDGGGWRATWSGEGGGVLLNQCPHQIDLFQWFFGMPSKVTAFCSLGKYHNIEVEDDVTAYMEYPEGHTSTFITSTGEAPGTNRLEVMGDRGRLVVEDGKILFTRTEAAVAEYTRTTDKRFEGPGTWNIEIPCHNEGIVGHQGIIANFVDAILDGKELIAPAEEGIKSVELANCMLYSSLEGNTVELPLNSTKFASKLGDLIKNSTYVKPEVSEERQDDFAASFNK
ncbi:MAG: Gfo/Idh/MocA family oxidoreductase [Victivallales bacterium]|nr:Gfo/Idh/MocA family oxidoreductase [Victivallales bacterium]